jgi:hypothetical protein
MLAHFDTDDDGDLVVESVDCPMPLEVTCASFTSPAALTAHLLDEHDAQQVAQLCARLSIEGNVLRRAMDELQSAERTAEDLAESWFPTAHYNDEPLGVVTGLKNLPLMTEGRGE